MQLGIMDTPEFTGFDTKELHLSEKCAVPDTIFHSSPLAEIEETMVTPLNQLSSCAPLDAFDPQCEPSLESKVGSEL